MSKWQEFFLYIALIMSVAGVFFVFVYASLLQSQIDSLRQKSDKSVLFLAQEELSRKGLSLVVVDSAGKASLLRIKEGF